MVDRVDVWMDARMVARVAAGVDLRTRMGKNLHALVVAQSNAGAIKTEWCNQKQRSVVLNCLRQVNPG